MQKRPGKKNIEKVEGGFTNTISVVFFFLWGGCWAKKVSSVCVSMENPVK